MPKSLSRSIKLALCAALLTPLLGSSLALAAAAPDASGAAATVIDATVQPAASGQSIPMSFMGFSIEWGLIDRLITTDHGRQQAMINLLNQLKPFNGPLLLRIGGNSQDEAVYQLPKHTDLPKFVHIDISKDTLSRLAKVNKATGSKYIIGLNLAIDKPMLAKQLVSESKQVIGSGNIVDYEIGNEPDLFYRKGDIFTPNTIESYMQRWAVYYDAIKPLLSAPNKIVGPALAGKWKVGPFIRKEHARIDLVSLHRYPMGATVTDPKSPEFPSIANILNNRSAAGYSHVVSKVIAVAKPYQLPVRFGETNSAYHSGKQGVSDTFASTLWGVDTLFETAKAGGSGIDFHMSQGNDGLNGYYDPVSYTSDSPLQVKPLFYALWMFGQAVQNGGHLLNVDYHSNANVKLWAVEDRSGAIRVVVLNKDLHSNAKIDLSLPGYGSATVERLMAPSADATDHVTWGGETFDGSSNGKPKKLSGSSSLTTLTGTKGHYSVDVAHVSGALVFFKPR